MSVVAPPAAPAAAAAATAAAAAPAASRSAPCYADASYWDRRYSSQPLDFEWFYGWQALRRLIKAQLPVGKPLLNVGCGNSNLQEMMAAAGFRPITNVDISAVVISQMREKHAGMEGLEYVQADCRDMHMFPACHFWGAMDKGTVDALLCSKEGVSDVTRMCAEVLRVLRPGGVFLVVSLGEPRQRVPLLCQPCLEWDSVKVLLLPRVPQDQMVQVPGRALPFNDTLQPIRPLGPFTINQDLSVEGLPAPWDASQYFYAYVCRKKPLVLQVSSKVSGQLPESWQSAARKTMEKLQEELGLQPDLFSRGMRRRRMRMSEFVALQQQQQQRQPAQQSLSSQTSQAAALLQHLQGSGSLLKRQHAQRAAVPRSKSVDERELLDLALEQQQQEEEQVECMDVAGGAQQEGGLTEGGVEELGGRPHQRLSRREQQARHGSTEGSSTCSRREMSHDGEADEGTQPGPAAAGARLQTSVSPEQRSQPAHAHPARHGADAARLFHGNTLMRTSTSYGALVDLCEYTRVSHGHPLPPHAHAPNQTQHSQQPQGQHEGAEQGGPEARGGPRIMSQQSGLAVQANGSLRAADAAAGEDPGSPPLGQGRDEERQEQGLMREAG